MKINRLLGLLIGFCLGLAVAAVDLRRPGKVIIDTDVGPDDAAAILLALAAEKEVPGFEVIGITCSYGNTAVTNVAKNVQKVLTVAKRTDIPIYVGAAKPFVDNYTDTYYFGKDGMNDPEFNEEIIAKVDYSKHASLAMIELARKHAGNVSVFALAPLSNVAMAMTLDPNFVHNVDRFYIMGSSPYGRGSVAPNVDFNFKHDPESNFIVLNRTVSPPAQLMPAGKMLTLAIPMKWRVEVLGSLKSRTMEFLNSIDHKHFHRSKFNSADLALVALGIWPELITDTQVVNMTPVTDGAARGSVLVDYAQITGKPVNAELLENFDVEGYKKVLLKHFA